MRLLHFSQLGSLFDHCSHHHDDKQEGRDVSFTLMIVVMLRCCTLYLYLYIISILRRPLCGLFDVRSGRYGWEGGRLLPLCAAFNDRTSGAGESWADPSLDEPFLPLILS